MRNLSIRYIVVALLGWLALLGGPARDWGMGRKKGTRVISRSP